MKVGVIGGHNECGMHIANLLQTKPLEKIIIVGEPQEKKTDLASLLKERGVKIINPYPLDKFTNAQPLSRIERRKLKRKK